jgi:hypothetical protein
MNFWRFVSVFQLFYEFYESFMLHFFIFLSFSECLFKIFEYFEHFLFFTSSRHSVHANLNPSYTAIIQMNIPSCSKPHVDLVCVGDPPNPQVDVATRVCAPGLAKQSLKGRWRQGDVESQRSRHTASAWWQPQLEGVAMVDERTRKGRGVRLQRWLWGVVAVATGATAT